MARKTGPPPNRSEQTRRRNKREIEPEQMLGAAAEPPEIDESLLHPLAVELFEIAKASPESQFFTPLVWRRFKVHLTLLSTLLDSGSPSATMYAALQSDWRDFLISPADQRRLGIEIQKAAADEDEEAADATILALHGRISG